MTVPLPEALKKHLRPLPLGAAVALRQPQQVARAWLVTSAGERDVTERCVVAALRPLTIAVGGDVDASGVPSLGDASLRFIDVETQYVLAELKLRRVSERHGDGAELVFYEIETDAQVMLPWPQRHWNRYLQMRAARAKKPDPNNFSMSPEALQQMMTFYICPRPVVLVSVQDGAESNLFPMDLIGPVSESRFTLALRSTSPSIATMKAARKVALSDLPASLTSVGYKLGAHHKKVSIDWSELPFEIGRTELFSLPYPKPALRVRELEILEFETLGSHTFFTTRVVSEVPLNEGAQLFHTSGNYQWFRARAGNAFELATQAGGVHA